jgi:3-oxoadipate enol-lactonase
MPYSVHKGVRTYYEVTGEGPDLLLLHASPWDHTMWLYQIAHFSTWFRVIAPDIRSFGRSDVVTTPFPFEVITEEMIALSERENIKNAVVMGASLGCRLTITLIHDRPDLFKAAILVGGSAESSGSSDSDRLRQERISRYRDGNATQAYEWQLRGTLSEHWQQTVLGRTIVSAMLEKAPSVNGLARARIAEAQAGMNRSALLPRILQPVLVVTGEFDRSLESAKAATKRMPKGEHRTLSQTGHCCCIEDPATFDAWVIDFLTAHGLMPRPGRT